MHYYPKSWRRFERKYIDPNGAFLKGFFGPYPGDEHIENFSLQLAVNGIRAFDNKSSLCIGQPSIATIDTRSWSGSGSGSGSLHPEGRKLSQTIPLWG